MRHGIQAGVSGEGNDDSPNRQLIIAIEEVPHKLYQREGDMLVHVKPLSLKQALLGVTTELETLDNHKHVIAIQPEVSRSAASFCISITHIRSPPQNIYYNGQVARM